MAEDVMQQPWVCVACRAHLVFGQLRMCKEGGCLVCPICHSDEICAADGAVHHFVVPAGDEYFGVFGATMH